MFILIGQFKKIKEYIDKNLIQFIDSGRLAKSPIFYNNLSKYLDLNYIITYANCKDTIQITFMALDLKLRSHDNYMYEKKYWDYTLKLYFKISKYFA